MTQPSTFALALLAASLFVSGCKHAGTPQGSESSNTPPGESSNTPPIAQPPADPATLGSVEGTVHSSGKAPARIKIDMSADPACAMAPGDNFTEQYVVSEGKLANVFVYIKSGAPPSRAPRNTPPVVLDQKGCRYVPHVIAVQQGGLVEFRNSDPTNHNVHMIATLGGNETVDISQGPGGAPVTHGFNAPELMIPVRCNNHPWMQAFINVAPTPFFAVSATDGGFRISGLPPGTYTLAAVHEKLGEQDTQITVAPHTTANANFTFGPK